MLQLPVTGTTGLLALFGSPVAHSRSPRMYNYCFALHQQDLVYVSLDVQAEEMEAAIRAFRLFRMRGGNVTMPCKTVAAELMDELSPVARISGAVNTIVNEDGHLIGHNTDGLGVVNSLAERGVSIQDQTIVLVGAGGASTAIAVQSVLDGAGCLRVFNRPGRNFDRMAGVFRELEAIGVKCRLELLDLNDRTLFEEAVASADILINATSVGMSPNESASIITNPACLHPELTVYDVIYHPVKTLLMQQAEQQGVRNVIGGVGMLLHQGAAAYRLFTGLDMPVEQVRRDVLGDLL
jgi:shikimate dehydrogenase